MNRFQTKTPVFIFLALRDRIRKTCFRMKAEKIISARYGEKRDSIQIEYARYLQRIGQLFTNDMKNELSFIRILSREASLKLA